MLRVTGFGQFSARDIGCEESSGTNGTKRRGCEVASCRVPYDSRRILLYWPLLTTHSTPTTPAPHPHPQPPSAHLCRAAVVNGIPGRASLQWFDAATMAHTMELEVRAPTALL